MRGEGIQILFLPSLEQRKSIGQDGMHVTLSLDLSISPLAGVANLCLVQALLTHSQREMPLMTMVCNWPASAVLLAKKAANYCLTNSL